MENKYEGYIMRGQRKIRVDGKQEKIKYEVLLRLEAAKIYKKKKQKYMVSENMSGFQVNMRGNFCEEPELKNKIKL